MAQDDSKSVRDILGKVQQAYHQGNYLGFRIKYLYANEGSPGKHLDSLAGEVQMDKDRFRFVIDGTETIVTDKYAIQVMKEEKTIYLSKTRNAAMASPVSMLDSVFAHIDGMKGGIRKEAGSEVVTLQFPPGYSYSVIQFSIDDKTKYFQKISYSLNTKGLVDQELIESPGHSAPYQSRGQVEIVFSNYESGRFGEDLFRVDNYFNKTAGRIEPADRYKEYHLFLASSNL